MAIVNGTVSVSIQIEGTGQGAKKVEEAAGSIKKLERTATTATAATSSLGDRIGGLKNDAKSIDGLRNGFEMLRANFGFIAGAIGGVIAVATTLWELLGAGSPIPQFIVDTEKASIAEYEFAKQLYQTVEASQKAAIGIDSVRSATLKLAAANATAAGDQKRAADLLRSAGVVEANAQVVETEKSINDIFERRQKLVAAATAAENRAKQLRGDATRAEFAGNQAGRAGDIELASRGLSASIVAKTSAALAEAEAAAARKEALSLSEQLGVQNEAIKAQKEALTRAADTTIVLDELLVMPEASKPGGAPDKQAALRKALLSGDQKAIDAAFKGAGSGGLAANDNQLDESLRATDALAKSSEQVINYVNALEQLQAGNFVRDFSLALSEALPGMGEFNGALSQIAETWSQWGAGSKSTRDAVVGSLGAIAKAGAAQIKDERARAGVLSIIELGLGFAAIASQNYPAAAAHFTASAILGSTAIFGGASGGSNGGGRGGGNQQTRPAQIGGETLGSGGVRVVIQGNYYGGRSEQEAGSDFARLTRRPQGTGFERGRDAA